MTEHLSEKQQEQVAEVTERFGQEWGERFTKAFPYINHGGVYVGMSFLLAELNDGHTEHAEDIWEAIDTAIGCVSERVGDALLKEVLGDGEG